MADPMTWVAVAGIVLGGVATVQSAQATDAAAKYNAKLAERNGEIAKSQTAAELERQRRMSAKKLGDIRASFSASGVTFEGSALDVLEESVGEAELERQNIQYQGKLKQQGYSADAAIERVRGENALQAGYTSAASNALTDGADAYKKFNKPTTGAPIIEKSTWSTP